MRKEADDAILRAEEAEKKIKEKDMVITSKDQEILSLTHRLGILEVDTEKLEAKLQDYKTSSLDSEHSKTTAENLVRKVQLLEEELDNAEKNLKETVEKYVSTDWGLVNDSNSTVVVPYRLRQVDVKAEHFERQVTRAEQERDGWEKKYEVSLEYY